MSSSNCCFLMCIQVFQEAGQVVWYSHLFQYFPQFIMIHTVKGFCIVNKAAATAKSLQSCLTLCDPIDGSPPGSTVPGILQARMLEWSAISFSNAWKWKVKVKSLSRVQLFTTPWTAACQASLSFIISQFAQIHVRWIEMPSNQLILCCPLLLLPSILGHGLVNLFFYVFVMNHTTTFKVTHLLSVCLNPLGCLPL